MAASLSRSSVLGENVAAGVEPKGTEAIAPGLGIDDVRKDARPAELVETERVVGAQVRDAFFGALAVRHLRGTNEVEVRVKLPAEERDIIAYTQQLVQKNRIDQAAFDALKQKHDVQWLVELTVAAAPAEESEAEMLAERALGPLVGAGRAVACRFGATLGGRGVGCLCLGIVHDTQRIRYAGYR